MSMPTAPSPIVTPHSFTFWTIFSACACSSSALVGMHPQRRHVPPSAFCFSTTATFKPSCAARMAATYPPVPAPITMTSYSLAIRCEVLSTFQRREGNKVGTARLARCLGRRRPFGIEFDDACTQLPVIVPQFPVRLCQPLETLRRAARLGKRDDGDDDGRAGQQPMQSQQSVVPYRTACNSVNLLREY